MWSSEVTGLTSSVEPVGGGAAWAVCSALLFTATGATVFPFVPKYNAPAINPPATTIAKGIRYGLVGFCVIVSSIKLIGFVLNVLE